MITSYDKDAIKQSLTIEQIFDLLQDMGAEPVLNQERSIIVSKTICHGGDSHKLYYYDNSHLFHCYTGCTNPSFDVFDLLQKKYECNLPKAIKIIALYFNLEFENNFKDNSFTLKDWEVLNKYNKIQSLNDNIIQQNIELKEIDASVLNFLPQPHIIPWEKEGISREVTLKRNICFNPVTQSIVIPHYDINNRLIGIRERTLIKEEEKYGKYKPAIINTIQYNHPLSFNLYNINNSKNNIKSMEKAIIFEGEKSCMKYASFFGEDADISVACCGSSLILYQIQLLLNLGVKEIIISFDRQYQEINDEEFQRWIKKLTKIHTNFNTLVSISFAFDKWGLLDYKDSPIDKGADVFMELFKRRIRL